MTVPSPRRADRASQVRRWQLAQAARHVNAGGVIAYPTEAVYGLGCDPRDGAAVLRLLTAQAAADCQGADTDRRALRRFAALHRQVARRDSFQTAQELARSCDLAAARAAGSPLLVERESCHAGRARHGTPVGGGAMPRLRRRAGLDQCQYQQASTGAYRARRAALFRRGYRLCTERCTGRARQAHADHRCAQRQGGARRLSDRAIPLSACSYYAVIQKLL